MLTDVEKLQARHILEGISQLVLTDAPCSARRKKYPKLCAYEELLVSDMKETAESLIDLLRLVGRAVEFRSAQQLARKHRLLAAGSIHAARRPVLFFVFHVVRNVYFERCTIHVRVPSMAPAQPSIEKEWRFCHSGLLCHPSAEKRYSFCRGRQDG